MHRWDEGRGRHRDSGNRVARIAATNGGTGQYGNGINVFRADNVLVSATMSPTAPSRRSGRILPPKITISGNQAFRSGETAIYAEFEFEGALIEGNVIDGAAIGISVANFDMAGGSRP